LLAFHRETRIDPALIHSLAFSLAYRRLTLGEPRRVNQPALPNRLRSSDYQGLKPVVSARAGKGRSIFLLLFDKFLRQKYKDGFSRCDGAIGSSLAKSYIKFSARFIARVRQRVSAFGLSGSSKYHARGTGSRVRVVITRSLLSANVYPRVSRALAGEKRQAEGHSQRRLERERQRETEREREREREQSAKG